MPWPAAIVNSKGHAMILRQEKPTALTKLATGIQGFDEITGGGLARGRTTLVMGGPGCGKTVFALQALVHAAVARKQAGLFVAFEEPAHQIVINAAGFGWDLPKLVDEKLFFLDAHLSPDDVQVGVFDLAGILSVLEAKAKELRATQIVFDGIDVLLNLLDDPEAARREVYRIRDWLARTGLTAILTHKGSDSGGEHGYEFLQFMTDCVVQLHHEVVDGSAFRSLRVVKYRGSGFEADAFPITLSAKAMELNTRGPVTLEYTVTDERVSSGIERLDTMLGGGYHRGDHVLISGAPGSAKSTLCALFAATCCERGDRTLFVSFDEGADQIVRNGRSVGIELGPHRASGLLSMHSTRTRGANIEMQFSDLRERVLAHHARCLVVDPLSALSMKTGHAASLDVTQQFLDFLKREGVTVMNTTQMEGLNANETTAVGVSSIADTWIHLSYLVQDGERNRALTIVKSRGTGHSNQVRELVLSDDGVALTDVFVSQGKVLMGMARWERRREDAAIKQRTQVATELRRLQLRLAQAEAAARLQVVQVEIESRSAEIAVMEDAASEAEESIADAKAMRGERRHADEPVS
jgi:circadian clock protein KaiC